ncbi:MAG: bifunctional 3-(3-hydroxy-phenyl)propionate/3-hydroxycinnamic acid hydroxylase [Alcanivoracaceae bacterium]|jgi:3-(3-hydroxy-phenyl)propionate hydroxylase|nr:bifunctional 3-(3-hydroxy-phenyl)propionate/3-hydroxycinnamic acid hydroxylase [Alcanivoracaceae bacterium]
MSVAAMPARELDTDVLVVGYGPVGAALAALLGGYGVRTLVIDREPDVMEHPRAIALDNEALRVLQMVGLEDAAFEKVVIPQVRMHCPYLREFARVNTTGSIDGHPKLVTFFQPQLERALRQKAEQFSSVTAQSCTELLSFSQQHDHVIADIRLPSGDRKKVRCRYLVGADGASSMVRNAIGQAFTGQTYAEDWLIVDAVNVPESMDHVEFLCDHRRPTPHMAAPGNRQRWEFMLQSGETAEDMLRDERIAELLAPWGRPDQMTIERKAVYRFHSRCATRFVNERVILAGDAAHITPPFVGQGLVAGLRDAANLGWKLAWAVQGRASPSIVESYDSERRPHARAMIRLARLMGRLVMPQSALAAMLIHGAMRAGRLFPPLRRLVDELEIKPANRFRRGLFAKFGGGSGLRSGGQFPQAFVRGPDGQIVLSDDLLGRGFSLVGFGLNPHRLLSAEMHARLQTLDVRVLCVQPRGQGAEPGCDTLEDVANGLLPTAAPRGWIALIRPDRVVMQAGPAEKIEMLLNQALSLLGSPEPSPISASLSEVLS